MSLIRILVVDDNPTNLKLAISVLEDAGHETFQATDAIQAISLIQQNPPDLILMDIALPGMDGLTLTRQLKADPATRHIPVIALTAYAMRGDDQRAMAAGCEGYLTKPIDTRTIALQVVKIFECASGKHTRPHGHTYR